MNFELFEAMSPTDAQEHLQDFLATESAAIEAMRPTIEEAGHTMDYSISSLAPILEWIFNRVQVRRVPVPHTEANWVRQAHEGGLIEFPEDSIYLILRAAYYLGESFVRTYPSLRWGTGNPGYMEKNMPVVIGFISGKELAPVMVINNVFKRVLRGQGTISHIGRVISTWQGFLEHHT